MKISPKVIGLVLGSMVCMLPLGAQNLSLQTAQDLLTTIDNQVSFLDSDFSAEYTITQEKPGQARTVQVLTMLRRDRLNTYTIIMTQPEVDKGKAYLRIGNNLWFWDPVAKKSQVTSAKDRFQNSNARNSDFTRSSLALDYRVTATSREKLGTFDCIVIELEARSDTVTFPFMKVWVSQDNLIRKYEDYSLSKQLMRTTIMPSYQRLGSRAIPVTITITDNVRGQQVQGRFVGEKTIISIAKPSTNNLPDSVFTLAYLERVAR